MVNQSDDTKYWKLRHFSRSQKEKVFLEDRIAQHEKEETKLLKKYPGVFGMLKYTYKIRFTFPLEMYTQVE